MTSNNCLENLCGKCCNNENCIRHRKNIDKTIKKNMILCKCKKTYYNRMCIDDFCNDCCNNKLCKGHYMTCICNQIIKKYNDIACCNNVCKKCCSNYECKIHFIQDYTKKLLNDYKMLLYKKTKFPNEIINYIVDEYVFIIKKKLCGWNRKKT
jgi:hypothetical protein